MRHAESMSWDLEITIIPVFFMTNIAFALPLIITSYQHHPTNEDFYKPRIIPLPCRLD